MHERPQLHDIVLERRPRQQQPPLGIEAQQGLPPLTFEILYVLRLVQNHIVPLLAPEGEMVLDHEFVRGDANVERIVFAPAVPLDLPLLLRAEVSKDLEARAPFLEFDFPVHDDCRWHNNEVRSPDAFVTRQGGQ